MYLSISCKVVFSLKEKRPVNDISTIWQCIVTSIRSYINESSYNYLSEEEKNYIHNYFTRCVSV